MDHIYKINIECPMFCNSQKINNFINNKNFKQKLSFWHNSYQMGHYIKALWEGSHSYARRYSWGFHTQMSFHLQFGFWTTWYLFHCILPKLWNQEQLLELFVVFHIQKYKFIIQELVYIIQYSKLTKQRITSRWWRTTSWLLKLKLYSMVKHEEMESGHKKYDIIIIRVIINQRKFYLLNININCLCAIKYTVKC